MHTTYTNTYKNHLSVEIRKGICGLPQARKLTNTVLKECLVKYDYFVTKCTPGLRKHTTKLVHCILVVDDFGVKFVDEENLIHLIVPLQHYC